MFVKVTLKPQKNIFARILEKELPVLEFSSEFCKNFEKTHFLQNLLVAATMLSFGWLIKIIILNYELFKLRFLFMLSDMI